MPPALSPPPTPLRHPGEALRHRIPRRPGELQPEHVRAGRRFQRYPCPFPWRDTAPPWTLLSSRRFFIPCRPGKSLSCRLPCRSSMLLPADVRTGRRFRGCMLPRRDPAPPATLLLTRRCSVLCCPGETQTVALGVDAPPPAIPVRVSRRRAASSRYPPPAVSVAVDEVSKFF